MTLYDVFQRLLTLDQAASSLLRDTGFQSEECLGDSVCPLPDEAEDEFLRGQAEELLESLEWIHSVLCYLKLPHHGEYTLEQFPSGRYGYFDKDGDEHIFTCGRLLEAKIHEPDDQQRWVRTRIEHDGSDYFIWGYRSVPLSGLTIRERG
jgi:hypothetical protein